MPHAIIDGLLPALDWLLAHPDTVLTRWLMLAGALAAGTLALLVAGRGMRLERCGPWSSLAAVLSAWAMAVAASAVAQVYLPFPAATIAWSVLALVGLVLGVLAVGGLMRVGYLTALFPWCAAMAAMAAVILIAQAVLGSIGTGARQTDGLLQRGMQLHELDRGQ